MILNNLAYAPPVGYGEHPWLFRREVLDPLFGSKQPHLMFGYQCFEANDPRKPQPDEVIKRVKDLEDRFGQHYAKVVILDIEFTSPDLDFNWDPMVTREETGEWTFRLEPGAMHKRISYVGRIKRGLPDYKVGFWGFVPSSRCHMLFNSTIATRDKWWAYNHALKPLGRAVDFTAPSFYWQLDPSEQGCFTLNQRARGIQLAAMVSHELYGKPCYPFIWPECVGKFRTDPWPDSTERQLARQMTAAEIANTVDACLEYGDGLVLWSQGLQSAPDGEATPFRWDYPWIPKLIDVGVW